jgi:riboflavin transporter FmnP
MASLPKSRRLSLIALFTALAAVLDLTITVPDPQTPYLFFGVWEIPIVISLILLGFWSGLTVAVLNALVLEAVKPGPLPTGPLYNLIAVTCVLASVSAAGWAANRWRLGALTLGVSATLLGATLRTLVMTGVNDVVLPLPYPVGFSFPAASVPAFLVFTAVFNFVVTLYTVPAAFGACRALGRRYKLPNPDSMLVKVP